MVKARRNGQMDQATWATIEKESGMALVHTNGQTATRMMAPGLIMRWTALERIRGPTADSMWATGSAISCTARAFTRGLTVVSMTESTRMTRKMAKELLHGQMDGATVVAGAMASSMGRRHLQQRVVSHAWAFGKMASA